MALFSECSSREEACDDETTDRTGYDRSECASEEVHYIALTSDIGHCLNDLHTASNRDHGR